MDQSLRITLYLGAQLLNPSCKCSVVSLTATLSSKVFVSFYIPTGHGCVLLFHLPSKLVFSGFLIVAILIEDFFCAFTFNLLVEILFGFIYSQVSCISCLSVLPLLPLFNYIFSTTLNSFEGRCYRLDVCIPQSS